MIKHLTTVLVVFLMAWQLLPFFGRGEGKIYPGKAIQIVVPYLAGGGTDTFARILQKSLIERDTLGVPVVIVNQDGGSATIGSRFVKNSPPDGYRLLCHHEGIIATKLAGVVPYGPEAFRPIAQTGSIVLLMVVRSDSPYKTLVDLLKAAQDQPREIRVGANQGSPAYFICKQMLSEFPGAEFNFVSAGGSKRISYLLGGKLEAGIFSLAEYKSFRNRDDAPLEENILAIGNFGKKRHPSLPDVATSTEQGLKTEAENAYYIWAPKETPDAIADTLADAFEETLADQAVINQLNQLSLDPVFRRGSDLDRHLAKRIEAFEKLAIKAETDLPDFVAWTIGIVAFLFGLVVVQFYFKKDGSDRSPNRTTPGELRFSRPGGFCMAILIAYVASLQWSVPFVVATPILIFLIGATIAKWQRSSLFPLAQTAILVGLGIQIVFTHLFTVALP